MIWSGPHQSALFRGADAISRGAEAPDRHQEDDAGNQKQQGCCQIYPIVHTNRGACEKRGGSCEKQLARDVIALCDPRRHAR